MMNRLVGRTSESLIVIQGFVGWSVNQRIASVERLPYAYAGIEAELRKGIAGVDYETQSSVV